MEGELMNNKARKVISLFLILAMVLGILPAMSPPVRGEGAEEITVNTWEELVNAMTSRSDYSKVILGKNMKYEYKYDRDNPHGIDNLVRVTNKKTLDLNGKKIELVDQSSAKRDGYRPAAFFIRAGGTLHVIDSKGGGEVWHHSQLREEWGWNEEVKNRTSHNVFDNSGGTLVIDGGKFIAGRKSKTWCFNVHRSTGMREGLTTIYYDGWAYNLSSGNAVRHSAGDTVINDGTFHSYGESTIKAVRGAHSSGKVTINGGDYRLMGAINYEATSVIDAAILMEKIDFHVNGGNFSTEKMIVRRGAEGSYQQTNYGWNVYLIEPYIAIGIPFITFNEDARFKYDGKNRDLEWVKSNLPSSSKKFEVIPGTPKLSLSPEVENDFYLLARGLGEYSIKGQVEPYFKDLGLGRPANVEYNIYDYDLGKNTRTREVWVDTSKNGLTTYAFIVDELTINGKKIGSSHKYFDVLVKDQPIPKITILPETNPVIKGDPVKLVAYSDKVDQLMKDYEWKYYDGELIGNGKAIEFTAPSEDGEYLIQCVGTDIYENKGVGLFLLQVGGEGARPRIATEELIFKQDKNSNGLYVENIGGPVNNDDWSVEGDLPPGLEFVTNIGLPGFRGTATEAGTWPVTIKADVVKGYEKTINIIVTAPIEIRTNPKLPDGVKGEEYQGAELYVSGGGDVKWTVIDGALPSGLDLDINTGKISGTPTPDYSGRFKFTVQAEVTGEMPATKNFNIDIHAKPEFEKSEIDITAPYGKETYFPNYLKEGTGDIEYWLIGAPSGVGITPGSDKTYGPGRIYVGNNLIKGDYEFTINAKGYNDNTASATVNLKVTEKPTLTDGMFVYLPYGEVNKMYSDNEMIKNSIYSAKGGIWELTSGELPAGLTLSNNGKITGTPTKDTDISSNGYPGSVSLTFEFTDTDGLSEKVYAYLYIVKAGDNKATSKIGFDTNKSNVQSATKATMYTGMLNQLFIDIDGVPRPEYEITGLPDWFSHSAQDGKGNVTLQSTFPPQTGNFNFTVKAKNKLNNDNWITQNLTIEVKNPEKAAAPVASKPSGTYKESDLKTVKLKNNESGTVKIFYSINGSEFTGEHVEKDGEVSIAITEDTTIRTYTDTLFALGGVNKSNSDIVTYKYMVLEDDSKALITIENKSLANGKVDTAYTDVELKGSSSNGKDLSWTVTGLPAGLELDSTGKKIEGTPSVAGDFNVTLLASADGADTSKKVLQLHIEDKSLPKAENPTIKTQPISKDYELGASATALTVKASADGSLSYLWYESQDNRTDTPEDDKIVAMEKDFTPPTNREGEKYYYALVSNSKDNHQAGRARSNLATITVKLDAKTPYFDDTDARNYLFTQNTEQTIMEMALVDDDGLLSYEWYKMKGTSPNPTSDDKISNHNKDGILTITTPSTNGAVDKYYAMVTNTKDSATGNKTAGPIQSPIHIVEVTEKVRYEITFDLQNDDLPEDERTFTVTTDFDGKLGGLAQPEREGFTFKGWYKEANGSSKVTSDEVYTKNTKLYAQWTAESYTVTVQDDGKGAGTANPPSAEAGKEISLTATANEGYKFKEWQIVSGGVTIVDNKFTMPSENVVIKAIFEEISIAVDKTTLIDAIALAKTNKATAGVSTDGTDIDPSDKWVSQAEMDAYTGAISIAQGVADKTDASQGEVDKAVAELNTATIAFNSAKKAGTKVVTEITRVNISPKSTSIEKGKTQQFIANVIGTGSFDKTVIWSLDGNNDAKTTISSSGLLTVDAEETATSLTVIATSKGNSSISDSAKVTVIDQPVTTYTVTVNNGSGSGNYAADATVSITANEPEKGKVFDKWTTTDGVEFENVKNTTTTFVMPANDVAVTATYKDISSETPDYKIIDGENGIWKKGNTKGIVIISNGDYGDFTGVNVDGIFIDSSNYTSAAGSTVVTLKPAYLETLAVGTHIVTLQFGNYSVQTNLTILAADERPDESKPDESKPDESKPDESKPDESKPDESKPDESKPDESKPNEEIPKTGDSNHTLPLIGLLLLSGSALIGVTRNKKKKKSYNK